MSELRSVIESLRAESLAELPDARVEEDFSELHEAVEALEAERLRRLAEIDRRRLFERDGHLSAASWLVRGFSLGWSQAADSVRLARRLDELPGVRQVLEAGAVSLSAVKMLAEAHCAEPEAFSTAEPMLVEAASRHSIVDLRRVLSHWRHLVESERAEHGDVCDVARARRRLHASVTFGGMVRVDADLDPETGETFLTALRAVLDTEARSAGAGDDGCRAEWRRRPHPSLAPCRRPRRDMPGVARPVGPSGGRRRTPAHERHGSPDGARGVRGRRRARPDRNDRS